MTATAADRRAHSFDHEAFFYRDDDEFLTGLTAFIRDGLHEDAAVVVAEPPTRIALLREALGDDADAVAFLDMTALGKNPARIIAAWHSYVDTIAARGRPLRGVGEPAYVGRTPVELDECKLHELLLNRAFDDGPGWRLLCPYDTTGLDGGAVAGARRTHPVVSGVGARRSSDAYDADVADMFSAPLPPPPRDAAHLDFTMSELTAVRRAVRAVAGTAGLTPSRRDDLVVAAHELAVNSISHGGGRGALTTWQDGAALMVQFSDAGVVGDPLVGRRHPTMGQEGGRGVYLVNQLCDLVQLRSSAAGTVVRVTSWL